MLILGPIVLVWLEKSNRRAWDASENASRVFSKFIFFIFFFFYFSNVFFFGMVNLQARQPLPPLPLLSPTHRCVNMRLPPFLPQPQPRDMSTCVYHDFYHNHNVNTSACYKRHDDGKEGTGGDCKRARTSNVRASGARATSPAPRCVFFFIFLHSFYLLYTCLLLQLHITQHWALRHATSPPPLLATCHVTTTHPHATSTCWRVPYHHHHPLGGCSNSSSSRGPRRVMSRPCYVFFFIFSFHFFFIIIISPNLSFGHLVHFCPHIFPYFFHFRRFY